MDRRRTAFLGAVAVAIVAALFVLDARIDISSVLVVLLGAGVAVTVLTGYGGQYLFLCLGEAFAVAIGVASPLLGVLFQPAIAGMLCDDDMTSLLVGGSTALLAAAGVLVIRQPPFLLLAGIVASVCVAAGLMVFDVWVRRRFSPGDTA